MPLSSLHSILLRVSAYALLLVCSTVGRPLEDQWAILFKIVRFKMFEQILWGVNICHEKYPTRN